jgi:hypothetical protein
MSFGKPDPLPPSGEPAEEIILFSLSLDIWR